METYTLDKEIVKVVKWTMKAASKDTARPVLCHLLIGRDDTGATVLVAADGYRLHIATVDNLDLPEGMFPVVQASKDLLILGEEFTEGMYPDFKAIIPRKTHEGSIFYCNPKYMADALAMPVPVSVPVRVQSTDRNKPIRIEANMAFVTMTAIVMPMHSKED